MRLIQIKKSKKNNNKKHTHTHNSVASLIVRKDYFVVGIYFLRISIYGACFIPI